MKNKIYMFFYGITIRRYTKNDLNILYLDNVKKINSCKANSYMRRTLILQNKCITKRLKKIGGVK